MLLTHLKNVDPTEVTRRGSASGALVSTLYALILGVALVLGGATSAWAATEQIPATDWEKELEDLDLPEEELPLHKRLSITVSGGTNACIKDGKAKCSNIDMSGAGGLGLFFAALPKLHVGLDLRFGALTPQPNPAIKEQGMSTFYMMPTAVWIEPFTDRWRGEGRLGLGYASQGHSYTSDDGSAKGTNWVSWLGMNLGVAVSMKVTDSLDAGLGADLYLQSGGTICTETVGSECKDNEDDVTDIVQSVLFVRYRL